MYVCINLQQRTIHNMHREPFFLPTTNRLLDGYGLTKFYKRTVYTDTLKYVLMRLEHTYTISKLHSQGKRNLKKHYFIKIIILSIKSKKV